MNVNVINAKLAAIDAKTDTLATIKADTVANKNEIEKTKNELSTLRELCMIEQNTMEVKHKAYDQQLEATRIRNDEIKELQARVAALTEKEKQVDEIRANLLVVSAAADATYKIEKNFMEVLNNEKQLRAQAQAELTELRKTIEDGIMTKVENRIKDGVPGVGINTIPNELIKLVRKEELKTIIIHRIYNTDPDLNIFELDPYNIMNTLAERLDHQFPNLNWSMIDELQTTLSHCLEAKFGYYKRITENNRQSRPLYLTFATVESAESFKQWIYRSKSLLKSLEWTRDQLYLMNVSNKRSAETMKSCGEMQESFEHHIRNKFNVFDRVNAEVEPHNLNIILRLRFKEEIAKRMSLKKWATLSTIKQEGVISLPAEFTQDDFVATLKSTKIRYDRVRSTVKHSTGPSVNSIPMGERTPATVSWPPLLPQGLSTTASANTVTPPTAPAHTQMIQPTAPGLVTTASTQPGNPPTIFNSVPTTGSYANAVTGFTAQRATPQPDLQEKIPVYLNPIMAQQLSTILAGASCQPAPTTQ